MLTNSPVVIVFRRVADADAQGSFVSERLNWTELPPGPAGQDPFLRIYDAGGVLVGFSMQRADCGGNCCSNISLEPIDLYGNPASRLLLLPDEDRAVVGQLSDFRPSLRSLIDADLADELSLFDENGNQLGLLSQRASRSRSRIGERYRQVLRDLAPSRAAPLVGIELSVSSLPVSQEFYSNVLGLRLLGLTEEVAQFDVGNTILSLVQERIAGMVEKARESGRLKEDWTVFWVEDLESEISSLEAQGVEFPAGVEEWDDGRQAYFNDPDGHFLCIWQPGDAPSNVDFRPALQQKLAVARGQV